MKIKASKTLLCSCGSGKKYKKCCGWKSSQENTGVVSSGSSIAEKFQKAVRYHQAGELDQAENIYREILEIDQNQTSVYLNLGKICENRGRLAEAKSYYQKGLELNPDDPHVYNNLGIIAFGEEKLEEAKRLYEKALLIKPDFAEAWNNMGLVSYSRGASNDGRVCFQKALKIKPDYPDAYVNLGNLDMMQGKKEEALSSFKKAIELNPGHAAAHNNLGNIFKNDDKLEEAEIYYLKAIVLNPDNFDAYNNLGNIYSYHGKIEEARANYQKALNLNPKHVLAYCNLLLSSNYSGDLTPSEIFSEHLLFDKLFGEPLRSEIRPHFNERSPERKLKIGYVSSDFKLHAVSFFLEPLLANHNHRQFEIFCYANDLSSDQATMRMKSHADKWRNISGLPDEEVAREIRQDEIDILIDLNGHTHGQRLLVFARKPAPVQAAWLGYLNTTGLSTIDYRITDRYTDPPGMTEQFHTEQLIRLPDCFGCYQPPVNSPDVTDLPALKTGHITFGSLNNFSKINRHVIALWAKVLKAIPQSRLILKTSGLNEKGMRESVYKRFADQGIPRDRIELLGKDLWPMHLEVYSRIDIGLDPFPYNGGATSCEALWMGVPVMTLEGRSHLGRMGVSLLSALGLEEWIARTPEEYIAMAVRMATNLDRLSGLRRGMRARMTESPLMDAKRFALNMESIYRNIWRNYCSRPAMTDATGEDSNISEKFQRALHYQQSGDLEKAEALYQEILLINPRMVDVYLNLGNISGKKGLFKEAKSLYEKALELSPDNPFVYNNLGIVFSNEEKREEAKKCFEKALSFKDNFAEAWNNLGMVLKSMGLFKEAMGLIQKAITIKPDYADAFNNLGTIHVIQGDKKEAMASFQKAITLHSGHAAAHNNLGNIFRNDEKFEDAEASYLKAMRLHSDPSDAYDAHNNLGNIYAYQGKIAESRASYKKALILKPNYVVAYCNLLLSSNYTDDLTPSEVFSEHYLFDKRFGEPLRSAIKPHLNDRSPDRRLRIGYISPDFRTHSVSFFLEPVLVNHESREFELFCYSDSLAWDQMTRRLHSCADQWRNITGLPDEEVARLIRQDGIDILVDLCGHTGFNRLLVFARKPAPVQVTWLGYPNTTGLSAMDYRITDQYADPAGTTEQYHTEQLIRLPESFSCYRPPDDAPEVGKLPAARNGFVTFGSFNMFCKVTPRVIGLWAEVLKTIPGSRLVLKSGGLSEKGMKERIEKTFASLGVAPDRIDLLEKDLSPALHLKRYNEIDIGLDPFPYNGTTTTCEALWMGVPVITLEGKTHAGRVGVSLLNNLGLTELIAKTEEGYVGIASRLAKNLDHLAQLRQGMRAGMISSPLMDEKGFTQNLEEAYRNIWKSYVDKEGRSLLGIDQDIKLQSAKEHLQEGELDLAETLYHQILIDDSSNPVVLHDLGVIAYKKGNHLASADYFLKAIAIKPDFETAYNNIGVVCKELGRRDEAKAFYDRAISLKPEYAEAHYNLGILFRLQEKRDHALACFRQALAFNPDYADARQELEELTSEKNFVIASSVRGRVLMSYMKDPALWNDDDIRFRGHSNKWESREIVKIFKELGYVVDCIDFTDKTFSPSAGYDVIFDIWDNLQRIAPFLSPDTVKILHLTSSYPGYSNDAELKRIDELEKRRKALCMPRRTVAFRELGERSIRIADSISLIGNAHTLQTYPEKYRDKMTLVSVSASQVKAIKTRKEYLTDQREFLWFFGAGAVHKGLDLVLEVFSKSRDLTLNIVGNVESERDFCKIYENELTRLPNIKLHGYLDPADPKFEEIVKRAFCFIAPSCSEGISPSVATLLQIGLFPIISRETGVTLPEKCGIYLEKCTIEETERAVFEALKMNETVIKDQIEACQAFALEQYSRKKYREEMTRFISSAVGRSRFDRVETRRAKKEDEASPESSSGPGIGLVIATAGVSQERISATISSVIKQKDRNWRLILLCEKNGGLLVPDYFLRDERIKAVYYDQQEEKIHLLNKTLAAMPGEFLLLLNHLELAPSALFEIGRLTRQDPDIDLIYSDGEKNAFGWEKGGPSYKPAWSPDYLFSYNYIGPFLVIKKSLFKQLGGFKPGYDGAEEYEFLLRATDQSRKIAHLPAILYHEGIKSQPMTAITSQKRAIAETLKRRGVRAAVLDTSYSGIFRVKYQITDDKKVSIIIPTKDKVEVLEKCIDSILTKTTYKNYEILVVNNQSSEQRTFDYFKTLEANPVIKVLKYDQPFNYSKINNFGAARSRGYYLLFLNNDTEVISGDWLSAMIEFGQRKTTGVVGAKLLYPNNTIQHAGVIIAPEGRILAHFHSRCHGNIAGYEGRVMSIHNLSAVTGACLLMRREVFDEVGGFDERFVVNFNDIDLCVKSRKKGYDVVYTPFAELYHHESLSRGYPDNPEKIEEVKCALDLFREKWGGYFALGDPFASPNLESQS